MLVWVCSLWLGIGLILAAPAPATATLLYTADAADAVVVQSRRTLRDQTRQSWQVIAFQAVRPPSDPFPPIVSLRLIGFPGQTQVDHLIPANLTDETGRGWQLIDRTDRIIGSPPPSVAEYDLSPVLSDLPLDRRLQLAVPTLQSAPVVLGIPPALVREWQTVATTRAQQLMDQCDRFPLEARQNPQFPDWTGCRIKAATAAEEEPGLVDAIESSN
jgi:hypothetical protein